MLCAFCPPTILGDLYRIPEKSPKSSADKMNRACKGKDQTLKKTRTLHSSDFAFLRKILVSVNYCPQFWGRKWLRRLYGRPEFLCFFCRKTSMSIKFLVLGGGWVWGGGGVPILFYSETPRCPEDRFVHKIAFPPPPPGKVSILRISH